MTPVFDIRLDDSTDYDLTIQDDDLLIGDATRQYQRSLIRWGKGWNPFCPTVGAGLDRYLLDRGISASDRALIGRASGLAGSVRSELTRDGMFVESLTFQNGEMNLAAYYP